MKTIQRILGLCLSVSLAYIGFLLMTKDYGNHGTTTAVVFMLFGVVFIFISVIILGLSGILTYVDPQLQAEIDELGGADKIRKENEALINERYYLLENKKNLNKQIEWYNDVIDRKIKELEALDAKLKDY